MSFSLKDRHLFGAGAAACAVCCAAPVLTLLGVAGATATLATFAFAGLVFALGVAAGALLGVWAHRRRRSSQSGDSSDGPVEIAVVTTAPPG